MSWARSLYRGADRLAGGYLPGAHRPNHEMIADAVTSGGSAAADATTSAWDVLSGERDWRRQKGLQEETWRREDTAVQRGQADLAAAGINPMLAGQYGGAPTSAPTARSHSAESVGRIASLAGGVLSGSVSAAKALTEVGAIKASTANTIANTARTISLLPHEMSREIAEVALKQAMVPDVQAGTAHKMQMTKESSARTEQTGVRTQQMRHELPKFASEADYYKRYGRSAVMARELRNPWQSSLLVADQAGRGPVANAINSAATLLDRSVNKLKTTPKRVKPMRATPNGL